MPGQSHTLNFQYSRGVIKLVFVPSRHSLSSFRFAVFASSIFHLASPFIFVSLLILHFAFIFFTLEVFRLPAKKTRKKTVFHIEATKISLNFRFISLLAKLNGAPYRRQIKKVMSLVQYYVYCE